MLRVLSPSHMAMDLSACCHAAPYCSHNQRQLQSQALPSLDATLTGDFASWGSKIPPHHQSQYGFNRVHPPPPLYPSQTLTFLNDHDKLRALSNPYPTSSQGPSWASSTYPGLGNDFAHATWLPNRTKDILQPSGSSSFSVRDSRDHLNGN